MKKIILIIFAFLIVSCEFLSDDSSDSDKGGYSIYIDGKWTRRDFVKLYTGTNCTVWKDDVISLSETEAEAIGVEFDSNYTTLVNTFATPYDVDGDGRTAIFVFAGDTGSPFLAGYFSPADFYTIYSNSNEKDIVYLNGANSSHLPDSDNFYGTMAHEFQHLCNFSQSVMVENGGNSSYSMSTWADEGMSEMAEAVVYGFAAKQDRVNYFDSNFSNGNVSLTIWASSLDDYAIVYSFMAFLYDQDSSIFDYMYDGGTSNSTSEIDSIINTNLTTGLDNEYISFLSALYNEDSTQFPGSFFPLGFSMAMSTLSNSSVMPYSFVFTSAAFTAINTNVSYFDSSGNVTVDENVARIATLLDHDSWVANSVTSTEATNSPSILVSPVLKSFSASSVPVENQKYDGISNDDIFVTE